MGKLAASSKFTMSWNNRYYFRGKETKSNCGNGVVQKDTLITLVKFDEENKWSLKRPHAPLVAGWRWIKSCFNFRKNAKRYWRVAIVTGVDEDHPMGIVDENGEIAVGDKLFEVDEKELEHVGLHDINLVRDTTGLGSWKYFEVLGNVSKCNVTDIRWGTKIDGESNKLIPKDV